MTIDFSRRFLQGMVRFRDINIDTGFAQADNNIIPVIQNGPDLLNLYGHYSCKYECLHDGLIKVKTFSGAHSKVTFSLPGSRQHGK